MQRYFLNIAYIGTKYNGVTKNLNIKDHVSIEGVLEQALNKIKSIKQIAIYPSSRTDAGVHATNTSIHIDLDRKIPPFVITKQLNTTLLVWNEQIRILKTIPVDKDFDARRDAISRTYLYRFAIRKEQIPDGIKPKMFRSQMFIPIEENCRCFFALNEGFEIDRLKEAAKMFVGVHDFRSFMKVSAEPRTFHANFCRRKIDNIQVRPGSTLATSFNIEKTLAQYDFWEIEFKSRAYFYRQIRNMVATLIAVGNGKINIRDVREMLTIPSKHSWDYRIQPVPSGGLYLIDVEYPPDIFKNVQYEENDDYSEQYKMETSQ